MSAAAVTMTALDAMHAISVLRIYRAKNTTSRDGVAMCNRVEEFLAQFASGQTTEIGLRDYFIAHAPVEPQQWFKPVLPPAPQYPAQIDDLDEIERNEKEAWMEDALETKNVTSTRLREYLQQVEAHRAAEREYRALALREMYVQWPAAWADAMLKARQS